MSVERVLKRSAINVIAFICVHSYLEGLYTLLRDSTPKNVTFVKINTILYLTDLCFFSSILFVLLISRTIFCRLLMSSFSLIGVQSAWLLCNSSFVFDYCHQHNNLISKINRAKVLLL